jgi:hypothetical protein
MKLDMRAAMNYLLRTSCPSRYLPRLLTAALDCGFRGKSPTIPG